MKIPILMYHAVSPRIVGDPEINPVHIPLKNFIGQVGWLYSEGYEAITLDELFRLKETKESAERKVVLTFDDGYFSLLEHVTPVLLKYNYKATLFLTTAAVGFGRYDSLPHFGSSYPLWDRPLTWDELRAMQEIGWEIEAHGHQHRVHNMISKDELEQEMGVCKSLIYSNLNRTSRHYSFPWGRYNSLCLGMLRKLGFTTGSSVQPGLVTSQTDIRRLPRIDVNRFVDLPSFQKLVQYGYSDSGQKRRNMLTNVIYKYPGVKDFLKRLNDRLKGE